MSGSIAAVKVSELTSGNQLFRCVPYSCTMLARSCVTRQAQADSAFPPVNLLLCKGCELGAEVKRHAVDVEVDPHAAARASRKHVPGLPHAKTKRTALPMLPPASLPPPAAEAAPVTPPPAHAAPGALAQTQSNEGDMPKKTKDLTGKEMAGVRVVKQLESNGEGVLFLVRHPCGHEETILGWSLRSYEKRKMVRRCKACRGSGAAATAVASKKPSAAARAPAPPTEPQSSTTRANPSVAAAQPTLEPAGQTHQFQLRRDYSVRIGLPIDLTRADVKRLSSWLDLLVFEEA